MGACIFLLLLMLGLMPWPWCSARCGGAAVLRAGVALGSGVAPLPRPDMGFHLGGGWSGFGSGEASGDLGGTLGVFSCRMSCRDFSSEDDFLGPWEPRAGGFTLVSAVVFEMWPKSR